MVSWIWRAVSFEIKSLQRLIDPPMHIVTFRLVISVKSCGFLLNPLWSVGLPQSSASNLCSCCLSQLSSFTLLSFSTSFLFYIVEGSNLTFVCLWQKNTFSVYVFSISTVSVSLPPVFFLGACLWSSSWEITSVCVLCASILCACRWSLVPIRVDTSI